MSLSAILNKLDSGDVFLDKDDIEEILDIRNALRKERNYKDADAIKESLFKNYGIILEDNKLNTLWRVS